MNRRTRQLSPLEGACLYTSLVLVICMLLSMLTGCASAPTPGTPPAQSDALSDALGRIGSRTAGQATGMGGSTASREVYTATGGGLLGQIGGAAVRNTTTEIQRWWSTRP